MDSTTHTLTIQMLAWLGDRPRTYDETMEAWRTSCPRLSIWEDACNDHLVAVGAAVTLTARGRAMLERFR
ncbi:MAG TPA: hypothetical protein VJO53_05210 [Candidatus Acidoferrales bacterium]|nr:hypothetical protein [Candidatus Acidoferrales bacterium]